MRNPCGRDVRRGFAPRECSEEEHAHPDDTMCDVEKARCAVRNSERPVIRRSEDDMIDSGVLEILRSAPQLEVMLLSRQPLSRKIVHGRHVEIASILDGDEALRMIDAIVRAVTESDGTSCRSFERYNQCVRALSCHGWADLVLSFPDRKMVVFLGDKAIGSHPIAIEPLRQVFEIPSESEE